MLLFSDISGGLSSRILGRIVGSTLGIPTLHHLFILLLVELHATLMEELGEFWSQEQVAKVMMPLFAVSQSMMRSRVLTDSV